MDIYPFLDDKPLALGDELVSVERGDTVQVVELGERLSEDGEGTVPTVRLRPEYFNGQLPFEGSTHRFCGKYSLTMYARPAN